MNNMNTYKILIGRRTYEDAYVEVEAESADEAAQKAKEQAVDLESHEWNIYDCEYEIHSVEILPVEEESHD